MTKELLEQYPDICAEIRELEECRRDLERVEAKLVELRMGNSKNASVPDSIAMYEDMRLDLRCRIRRANQAAFPHCT